MDKAASVGLRRGWRRVRLGDVVENVNDFFADRSGEAIRYVAGEHIDEGDLRVRRNGLTSDDLVPPTFNRLFKAGDVLFHSRNIRKLAQPDFDGLTGEKLFVLRTKNPMQLSQDLLLFLLNSERFRNYVEERWAGSTNKFLNKTPLMAYEFALPPIELQQRIVSSVRVAQDCELAYEQAREAAAALFRSAAQELLSPLEGWTSKRLEEVASVDRGKFSHRPRNLPEFFGGPYPFVQTGDIVASTGDLRGASQMLSDEGLKYSKSFPENSILMTIAANIGYTAITTQETWCPDSVVGIVPKDGTNVRFLEFVLRTKQRYLENHVATQTAQKNINLQDLRPLRLDIPDPASQKGIADKLYSLEKAIADLKLRFETARDFRARLANEMIGVGDV